MKVVEEVEVEVEAEGMVGEVMMEKTDQLLQVRAQSRIWILVRTRGGRSALCTILWCQRHMGLEVLEGGRESGATVMW